MIGFRLGKSENSTYKRKYIHKPTDPVEKLMKSKIRQLYKKLNERSGGYRIENPD